MSTTMTIEATTTTITHKSSMESSSDPNSNTKDASSKKNHRGSKRMALSAAITWLESLRVPKALEQRIIGGVGEQTAAIIIASDNDGIPVISGLDRVFFGTQPACEAMLICGFYPPRYLCYMVSGFICDIIQFFIDLMLHKVFLLEDASVCWALGFGISVSFRHTTHRYLVFGDYVGGYWKSLGRMYAGYSIIIVISTIFNIIMTRNLQLPHYVAWAVTLGWTGIVNYFILKKLWSFGGKGKKDDEPSASKDDKPVAGTEGSGGVEMSSPQKDLEMQDKQRAERRPQARKVDTKR
jgi:putative flippase GtrA